MTFFHWLMTSWWRNMSDIFYILSIPEMLYYHAIILMSSLDTLVNWYNVPNFGVDNCCRSPVFPLLTVSSFIEQIEPLSNLIEVVHRNACHFFRNTRLQSTKQSIQYRLIILSDRSSTYITKLADLLGHIVAQWYVSIGSDVGYQLSDGKSETNWYFKYVKEGEIREHW